MYLPNLEKYQKISIDALAYRIDVPESEIQDLILELDKSHLDTLWFAVTDDPEAVAAGTDVIVRTSDGNEESTWVWFPDGYLELVENSGTPGKSKYRSEPAFQPTREEKPKEITATSAVRSFLTKTLGIDVRAIYTNKRAHDHSVKISATPFYFPDGLTPKMVEEAVTEFGKTQGLNLSIKETTNHYGRISIIISVPDVMVPVRR